MRIVIIGSGTLGRHVAASFDDHELILVDRNADALAAAEESVDALTVFGEGTDRSTLESAEVGRADLVVALTPDDNANLVSAALAAELGCRRTVARVDRPSFYQTTSGIERDVLGVETLLCASRLLSGELVRRLNTHKNIQTFAFDGGRLHLALVVIDQKLGNRPSQFPKLVRAVVRGGTLHPVKQAGRPETGDHALLVGKPAPLTAALAEFGASYRQRAVLVGGGDVGVQMATILASVGSLDRLIDRDHARCYELASDLHDVKVVHGDGTSLGFLREERVESADALLAVTGSDESNLMTSLMARELGVERTFARVQRPGYGEVYSHLGITGVSPHETIARAVRWSVPENGIFQVENLAALGIDIVEFGIPRRDCERLNDIPFPPGSVVLSLAGDRHRVPDTQSRVTPHEHVVVALPADRRGMLERVIRKLHKRGNKK